MEISTSDRRTFLKRASLLAAGAQASDNSRNELRPMLVIAALAESQPPNPRTAFDPP